ncbi:universal stress protein [Halomarina litorea]|uniref:universal stress protein n=1 Tax=Halomarina litorea TaxID=2961595 RepID=UPI0020C56BF0|nr:universal stress protein [Halomarina sp. BCD28]
MYERILVPTDGSDIALAATDHAYELAAALGASVHVVYVIDESIERMLLSTQSMRSVLEALREDGEGVLAEAEQRAEEYGIEVTTELTHGTHVHETILEYARDHDVDLVVMGTQGREGLEHLLGSTTERVLMGSSIPVLAVSPEGVIDPSAGSGGNGAA